MANKIHLNGYVKRFLTPTNRFRDVMMKFAEKHNFDMTRSGELIIGSQERKDGSAMMPFTIQPLGNNWLRVWHHYFQNGDMMLDPQVDFYIDPDGNWFPCEYRQDNLGIRWQAWFYEWDKEANFWVVTKHAPKLYKEHKRFLQGADGWHKQLREMWLPLSAEVHYHDE